ncbi:MAG TPA: MoaD/ThiS family protein [Acidimicrobiales bacterium]|nr:MoaD/ThiS family protein [Acidimicrobiales bacterium]
MTHSATSGDPVEESGAVSVGGSSGPGLRNEARPPRAVRLLLFAAARQAAGTRQTELSGATVGDVLDQARDRFGADFSAILDGCRVWVNGEPSEPSTPLTDGDEVAILPPVSGG